MQVSETKRHSFPLESPAVFAPTNARYKVLGLLVALAALTYLDRLCISVAGPTIMQEFNFSKVEMGYIFSAFTFAYALFEVPSGWFGDRFGTRKALTRIVLWWSAFTMLTAATFGFASLFVVRMLFGAGEAGAIPNSASTVSRWFPAAQRGRAMGAVCIGHALGATATPFIVFWLIERQGWRLPFVEFGLLGIVWCAAWYFWFRDTPEQHPSANAAEVELIRAGSPPLHEGRSHGIPWRVFLRTKNIYFLCAMYICYGYGLYFYITWLPTYLMEARGFEKDWASIFSSLPWLCGAAAFVCGGWITDALVRRGRHKLARSGLGAFGLTMSALMLVFVALAEDKFVAAVLISVALFFQFLTTPAVWATCLDIGRSRAGVVSGTTNMFGNLAGTAAPIIFGYVVEAWGSWTIPFYIAAAIMACGVVMWLFIDPRRPLEEAA
ncbi:MAG TPA: MFS transporter [Pyrinomonadaceae bacterium]|jgi:sugar phosphate permease|nr:MFS transporter [Pyrinomonadaceae bacterium]